MSRFFRKARTLLSVYDEFPQIEIAAAVYERSNLGYLTSVSESTIDSLLDKSASSESLTAHRRAILESPIGATITSLYERIDEIKLTGTASFYMCYGDGRALLNAGIFTISHGEDGPTWETIAKYAGRGLAESAQLVSADEMKLAEQGSYEAIWNFAILNVISCGGWENPSVAVTKDKTGYFERHYCNDAMQATWDALSALMLLDAGTSRTLETGELVTLDQVAPLTGLSKRTLERYLKNRELPQPDVPGGGGRAHKWLWRSIRGGLSKVSGRALPEQFPGSRLI